MKPASWMGRVACLTAAGLLGGCGLFGGPARMAAAPVVVPPDGPVAQACPWVEGEHYRPAVVLPGTALVPPKPFIPGCAIVKFTVAADGRVADAALRAAYPLDDGPTALAALRQMRFAPARRPDAVFLIRLSLRRDPDGRVTVVPDTRRRVFGFWDWS
jgi:hypothetical protein